RCVVHARMAVGAPQAPLLQIGVTPSHSGEEDEPIDLDSNFEEDAGDDMEGESVEEEDEGVRPSEGDDSDPEWHDTQEILIAAHEEASTERETLVLEEALGGDDESMIGHHHASGFEEAPQPPPPPAVIASDPTWMPRDL
ncbi:hypothetical protein KI387_023072, partial [Taxus chinensis]